MKEATMYGANERAYAQLVSGAISTITQTSDIGGRMDGALREAPGAIVIFANRRPRNRIIRWDGLPLELGRVELAEDDTLDALISRKHLRLELYGRVWEVEDLGSRNGSFVRGEALKSKRSAPPGTLIRVGGALLLVVADTLGFQRSCVDTRRGIVSGPAFRKALDSIALSQRIGALPSLLISGESGTGKEIAARVFHESENASAPFVAVNCAAIPKDIAERLLFGSRRGAFSGATDAPGHVQAADGGTLFLDEVADLPLEVQTKLLRVLETREVVRLGATRGERVAVRICAATWRDLRKEIAAGRFREDLYFRISQPEIHLPPLRERIEEIPWHVQSALETCGLPCPIEATSPFVEACALRHWPGNVRELRAEVRRAAADACAREATTLGADALSPGAGQRITESDSSATAAPIPEDEVAQALAVEAGNVVGAARRLGIHRNKIRRWLSRHRLEARRFRE